MKRKYILVAAALAVLCAGMTACGTSQNTETSSSAPSSSSELSSSSVSSVSVSSEPTSSSVSSASSSYQVYKEETAIGTETHPEDQVNISEEQLTIGQQKSKEIAIQRYMQQGGMTREEAEARWQEKRAEGKKKNEEAAKKREELANLRQQELEAYEAARDKWYRENFGISSVDFDKLPPSEKADLVLSHPEVDRYTNPESSWDWKYQ